MVYTLSQLDTNQLGRPSCNGLAFCCSRTASARSDPCTLACLRVEGERNGESFCNEVLVRSKALSQRLPITGAPAETSMQ